MQHTRSSLLAFSVPTFRRPQELAKCLRSLIQAAGPHCVPICVVDDSCDDTNREVLERARNVYPHVEAVRNERNLGIDRNILKSVDVSSTEYVWLMGEDDRVLPDGVERVISILRTDKPDFLFVNYSSVNESVTRVLRERALSLTANTTEKADFFLAEHAWAAGFIGSCVVRKELWQQVDRTPYLDTWFAHVGIIMESVRNRSVYCLAQPLVWNRCGRPHTFTWVEETCAVLSGWERMISGLRRFYAADICDRAVRAFRRAHGLDTLSFLAYLRADGVSIRRVLGSGFGERQHIGYRMGAFAIGACPVWLVRGLKHTYDAMRAARARHINDFPPI